MLGPGLELEMEISPMLARTVLKVQSWLPLQWISPWHLQSTFLEKQVHIIGCAEKEAP